VPPSFAPGFRIFLPPRPTPLFVIPVPPSSPAVTSSRFQTAFVCRPLAGVAPTSRLLPFFPCHESGHLDFFFPVSAWRVFPPAEKGLPNRTVPPPMISSQRLTDFLLSKRDYLLPSSWFDDILFLNRFSRLRRFPPPLFAVSNSKTLSEGEGLVPY